MITKITLPSFLFLFYLHSVNSNIFVGTVSSTSSTLEACTSECVQYYIQTFNKFARSECSRGCRFYGLAILIGGNKQTEFNMSKSACHDCCSESYNEKTDQAACNIGCDTMARYQQEKFAFVSAFQDSLVFIFGQQYAHLQIADKMESDDILLDPAVMTDPALRRQMVLDLVDTRLPEMRVKTLPVNPDENGGEWWSDCSVRRVGVPRCLAASLLVLFTLLVLWFGLSCDDKSTMPSPPVLFDPEQAPPLPPKYSLLDDIKV
ncbi:transmembrane protein 59-like isoform X1 [Homalodisca vitripennis]|uniref:WSC domain-containing protein n=1 Tax=Homalodisca liturata TaxID=320908 RepID=A0A1B6JB30_9HEMI|nr:transmembrane protein 59-like isoform X1 [Homalodisca vitripennis]